MSQLFSNGYAIIIGVGNDLKETVNDAKAINKLLTDKEKAAYPENQVFLLTETDATRSNILDKFDNLIEKVNKNPDATVFIYYSGHGGRIKNNNNYFLLPYDFDRNNFENTAITGKQFKEKLNQIKSKKLVLILDCCYAGGMTKDKSKSLDFIPDTFKNSSIPPEVVSYLDEGSGIVFVASSKENETSLIKNGAQNSVFTSCMLDILEGKNVNDNQKYAKIFEVLNYLFEQVPVQTNNKQHPIINKVNNLDNNFALCYYKGGNKVKSPESLSDFKKEMIKTKLDALKKEWRTRQELIKRIREDLAIENRITERFYLEKNLLKKMEELSNLENEIDEFENQLK